MPPTLIFLETGLKKTFAGALDWPGWCRAGQDEAAALRSLLAYAPRYAQAMPGLGFQPPAALADFVVAERLPGSSSTDFGAPEALLAADASPFDAAALARALAILQGCWRALDRAARQAAGRALRSGPRGGGRDLDKMLAHLLEADLAYLSRLAWKHQPDPAEPRTAAIQRLRQSMQDALQAAAAGALPAHSPRGGKLWPPHTFVRRTAWHTLDHAWEIEDRIT